MNRNKILLLTLSLVIILPTTALAKGNENSQEGRKPVQIESKINIEQGKSQAYENESDSTDENKQNVQKENDKDKHEDHKQEVPLNKETKIDQTKSTEEITDEIKHNAQEDNSKDDSNEHKQEAQQNKADKKQQIEAFKTEMKTKHEQMKTIRQQTIALKQQIQQKKDQLSAIISDLQSGKKTLSDDMLTSLLTLSQKLQTDGEQVKATAEINTEINDTQNKVKASDFNNSLASMDKVIAKMQARLDALNQLNTDLDAALKIANMSTTPAPTTSGASNDSTTQTSGTTTTDSSTADSTGTTTTTQ